jgi:hypothetical protein
MLVPKGILPSPGLEKLKLISQSERALDEEVISLLP